MLAGGILGTLLALGFDATKFEGFLLYIGAAFCPLFGVVLADYFILKRGHYAAEDLYRRGRYWYTGGFHVRALAAWAAGFGVYRVCAGTGFAGGASIPAMIAAAGLYLAWPFGKEGKL